MRRSTAWLATTITLSVLPTGALAWHAECSRDAMTDAMSCVVLGTEAGIGVFYQASKTPRFVCLIGHDFPGRRGAMRVDRNKAVSTDTNGCAPAKLLVEQMRKGREIIARRYEWPYDYPKDRSGTLVGFSDALKDVDRARSEAEGR